MNSMNIGDFENITVFHEFLQDSESITFTTSNIRLPKEKPMIVRPLSRKDIFYSGSVYNLPEYQSQKSLANYRQSVISLPKSVRGMDPKDQDVERVVPERNYLLIELTAITLLESKMYDLYIFIDRTSLSMFGIARVFQRSTRNNDGHDSIKKSSISLYLHQQRVWNGGTLCAIFLFEDCS